MTSSDPLRGIHHVMALVAIGTNRHQASLVRWVGRLCDTARFGVPSVAEPHAVRLKLVAQRTVFELTVAQVAANRYQIELVDRRASQVVVVTRRALGGTGVILAFGGHRMSVATTERHGVFTVAVGDQTIEVVELAEAVLSAPFPSLVVAHSVEVGDLVTAGQPLLVLESMKLESTVRAPFDCRVRRLWVQAGGRAEPGAPLITLEPETPNGAKGETLPRAGAEDSATDLAGQGPPGGSSPEAGALLDPARTMGCAVSPGSILHSAISGYDVSDAEAILAMVRHLAGRTSEDHHREISLLDTFASLIEISPGVAAAPRSLGPVSVDDPTANEPGTGVLISSDPLGDRPGDANWAASADGFRQSVACRRLPGISATIVGGILAAWATDAPALLEAACAARSDPDSPLTSCAYPGADRTTADANGGGASSTEASAVLSRLSESPYAPPRIKALSDALLARLRSVDKTAPGRAEVAATADLLADPHWQNFDVTRVRVAGESSVYRCSDRATGADVRLVATTTPAPATDKASAVINAVRACLTALRLYISEMPHTSGGPPLVHVLVRLSEHVDVLGLLDGLQTDPRLASTLGTAAPALDLTQLLVAPPVTTARSYAALEMSCGPGGLVRSQVLHEPPNAVAALNGVAARTRKAHLRGLPDPIELGECLAGHRGQFVELDLDDTGSRLTEVHEPSGRPTCGVVVGRACTPTDLYPEGITRIMLCGNATQALGAVAEPECARIIAAIDLAERTGVPVEWFAISSGARISMTSGTENMDWVAAVLRRIITFTQSGGEINIVVAGINVGAQPYWNAEATMLMHTRGILVMTPGTSMVLTGKRSLDYSGGVSAADEQGIGGYEAVMGPNGQAQYQAASLADAIEVVAAHYRYCYVAPGERGPRRAPTEDPKDRDVSDAPHVLPGSAPNTVGDILSAEANPDRKRPFDIRSVMNAVMDRDHPPLERWRDMADAQTAVVMDVRVDGHAVCMIGIESHRQPRTGPLPSDGPESLGSGTLLPQSSKKIARAISASTGNRPVVVLANLAGFDGSPDSLRRLQLEYGAEIGRAVVNFVGRIVFCVIGRYHGGAFVVFSKRLNSGLRVLAVDGARASVIGGAPAANVVFASEVKRRVEADARIVALARDVARAGGGERGVLRLEIAAARELVHAHVVAEVAGEFDRVHDIDRAVAVGSVDLVIAACDLRPQIAAALMPPVDSAIVG